MRSRLVRSSSVASFAIFGAALLLAVVCYLPMWADPEHRTTGSAFHTNDPMQIMWFLKWVPWRLLHGSNPFMTHALFYPAGVSLSWNTLVPTLGILAAPITLTIGASVAYAVLLTLAPALATLTGFWWLRRHCRHTVAAVAGGLFIGFNPYMAGHMLGHVDLTFTALVPIMLMLGEDLLWRRPRSQRRTAVYLGLVTAAQIGVNEELVVITAIAAALLAAAALLVARRDVLASLRSTARHFALATAVCLVAASPLLVSQLFLSPNVALDGSQWRALPADYLAPLGRQLIEFGHHHHPSLGGAEDGVYLGPMLIAVLAVGISLTARRDRWVRAAALTLAALVVLSLGRGSVGGVTMPWGWVDTWPVLKSILPARFSFASAFVLAWLIARWLDALLPAAHERPVVRTRNALGLAAIAATALSLVPGQVGASPLPNVPFFSSASLRAALHPGEAVLLMPVPNFHDASGMYLQQQADFRFLQPGGYALRPDGPQGSTNAPPDSPLLHVYTIAQDSGASAVPTSELGAARSQLQAQHYGAIIVVRSGTRAQELALLAQQLTGHAADQSNNDVLIWFVNRRS